MYSDRSNPDVSHFFQAIVALTIILLFSLPLLAQDEAVEAKLDRYMQPYLETGNFSGAILLAKDGSLLVSKGYGFANFDLSVPATPKTKFPLGSIGKQFTAAAILQLEERGILSVGDKLSGFIPEFRLAKEVTLHQLLTHTHGIPDIDITSPYSATTSRLGLTTEDIIKQLNKQRLRFKPGTKYSYTNVGFWLLCVVIERASGKPYPEYLKENILDPLGMDGTAFDSGLVIENRASGYFRIHDGLLDSHYYKTPQEKLIYMTVEDLYKWDRGLHDAVILGPVSLQKMFTRQSDVYGYGWFVQSDLFDDTAIWHIGESPGFRGRINRLIESDVTVIVFSNIFNTPLTRISTDLMALVLGKPYTIPPSRKAAELTVEPGKFEGSFRDSSGYAIDIVQANGHLFLEFPNRDNLLGDNLVTRIVLFPLDRQTYFMMEMDAELRFLPEKDGSVKRLLFVIDGEATELTRFSKRTDNLAQPSAPDKRRRTDY